MARFDCLPPGTIPFAVSREIAASLIGVSPAKFDELVAAGRMPQPREIDRRVLWDTDELRASFRAIPRRGERSIENSWADVR